MRSTHSSVLAWRIPGGAWWAAVYGVAQSRTQLKRLSSSSTVRAKTLIYPGSLGLLKISSGGLPSKCSMRVCRHAHNSQVCNHLGSLQRMENLQDAVYSLLNNNFQSKTLRLFYLTSLCSFLIPQANQVLQSYLQSQAGVEEAILQADQALTAGDKAMAGTGED